MASLASSFVRRYFPGLLDKSSFDFRTFYGADSTLTIGDETVRGVAAIAERHSARLEAMKEYKIELKHVDGVNGPNQSVVVSVVGSYITRTAEHHFVHGFVLQPTPRRDHTFFVLSEWYRETNVVQDRSVRTKRDNDAAVETQAKPAAVAPVAPAPEPVSAAVEKPAKERKIRKKALVYVSNTPKRCTLGDIKEAANAYGKVLDVKRVGNDAVIEFLSLKVAEKAAASGLTVNGAATRTKMINEEELAQ